MIRLLMMLVVVLAACGGPRRTVRVSDEIAPPPEEPVSPRAEQPYVIKMTDGRRTWQIEVPAGAAAPAFEATIPLQLGEQPEVTGLPPTEADREILDAKRAAGETVEPEAPSYLRGLAQIRTLFRERRFELALVQVVALERAFPDDVRLLEMKGTLLLRLGRPTEARSSWERALALDPDNATVEKALEALPGG